MNPWKIALAPVSFRPQRAQICFVAFLSAVLLFAASGWAQPGRLPAILAPSQATPARIAALSGLWEGDWSDGKRTTLAVYRLDGDKAYVLHRFEAGKGLLAWNGWARATIVDGERPRLEWKNNWSAVSMELSADGRELKGLLRETRGGEEKSSFVTMRLRPGASALPAQAGEPMRCAVAGERIRRIEQQKDPAQRAALVEAFAASAKAGGAPLMEAGSAAGLSCATFLYRGPGKDVALSGVMNGDSEQKDYLARVADSDLFWIAQEYPSNSRLEYKYVVDGKQTLDPFNSHVAVFGRGSASELSLPGYRPPLDVVESPSVPKGAVEELAIPSARPDMSRTATIYLPPGYASSSARYAVLYLNDGFGVLKFGRITTILDNLIARKAIPPVIAVLLPSVKDRIAEYAMNPVFEAYMAEEVLPVIDQRYRTLADPAHRVVGGGSAGAVAALSLSLRHSELFGGCMAQSTATRPDVLASLLALAESGAKQPLRVYLDVGGFEADYNGMDLLEVSETLRDRLRAHGAQVHFTVVPEGHGWYNWRSRTGEALGFLLGAPAK